MKKRADWPIEYCEMCYHLTYSPIRDAICGKNQRYIWTNTNNLATRSRRNKPYKYMPRWCPLKSWNKNE